MRRLISLLAVIGVMAAMVAASAMPVFAAVNPNADRVAVLATFGNAIEPGLGGKQVSSLAEEGVICREASSNCPER